MSVKVSAKSESAKKVAQAKKSLKTMSAQEKNDLMVKAKVMTLKQATIANQALAKPYVAPGVSVSVKVSPRPAAPKAAVKK